jgi:hypothetical protein
MNHWTGSGRLTKEPELRYTQSGKAVTQFTLAVDRKRAATGKAETDFLPCIAWEKLAETIAEYCTKGVKLMVEGRVQVRSYEAKDKTRRYVTEIIVTGMEFCESRKSQEERAERAEMQEAPESQEPQQHNLFSGAKAVRDEEIPF